MSDINIDELGPVDYLAVGSPADQTNFSGDGASELSALIERNTIRVLDLVLIARGDDGSVDVGELRDVDDSEMGALRGLERDLPVLLRADRRPGPGLLRR
jgi:hypothetical protein